ncbi:hypothetical protein QZH41_020710, partial [Actinostola sp. cb2023]
MEPREQDVLQRYYQKLSEQLEPKDLLKHLGNLGATGGDDVQAVIEKWGLEDQTRQTQAEWLLENLRKHDQGMNFLVKGLLLSEIQDFLAREILEDESFEENGEFVRDIDRSCREVTKWPSIDSGAQMKEFTSCRNSFIEDDNTGVLALAEKVTLLESQLEDEVNKREEAEFEIMKLASDNRDLHDELFETRDRLFAASQHDIREDDFDGDMRDPEYTEQCATRDD